MGIQERREREREIRRQQIMIAAKKVFSEKGFRWATMADIAREAELSAGTLYLYFRHKEELYAALSLRILMYLKIRLEEIKEETNISHEQKIRAVWKVMHDAYKFDSWIMINMFSLQASETLKNISPQLLSQITELSSSIIGVIAKIFEEGINAGSIIERHPVALADIIGALFSGVVLREESKRIIDNGKDHLTRSLGIAFEIFSRGLKNKFN
jgi:AcrR family transcriptional regulator